MFSSWTIILFRSDIWPVALENRIIPYTYKKHAMLAEARVIRAHGRGLGSHLTTHKAGLKDASLSQIDLMDAE